MDEGALVADHVVGLRGKRGAEDHEIAFPKELVKLHIPAAELLLEVGLSGAGMVKDPHLEASGPAGHFRPDPPEAHDPQRGSPNILA